MTLNLFIEGENRDVPHKQQSKSFYIQQHQRAAKLKPCRPIINKSRAPTIYYWECESAWTKLYKLSLMHISLRFV